MLQIALECCLPLIRFCVILLIGLVDELVVGDHELFQKYELLVSLELPKFRKRTRWGSQDSAVVGVGWEVESVGAGLFGPCHILLLKQAIGPRLHEIYYN